MYRCSRCIEGSGREGFGLYARCAQAVCFIELWNERRDDSSKYVYVDISQSLSRMQSVTSASEVRLQVRVYSISILCRRGSMFRICLRSGGSGADNPSGHTLVERKACTVPCGRLC